MPLSAPCLQTCHVPTMHPPCHATPPEHGARGRLRDGVDEPHTLLVLPLRSIPRRPQPLGGAEVCVQAEAEEGGVGGTEVRAGLQQGQRSPNRSVRRGAPCSSPAADPPHSGGIPPAHSQHNSSIPTPLRLTGVGRVQLPQAGHCHSAVQLVGQGERLPPLACCRNRRIPRQRRRRAAACPAVLATAATRLASGAAAALSVRQPKVAGNLLFKLSRSRIVVRRGGCQAWLNAPRG